MEALAKQLAPGVSKADAKYLVAMLDGDGDGQVTYQELMDSVMEIVHAGNAAKDTHSPEALQIMQRIRDILTSRGREVEELFDEADVNGDGVLDFTELGRLFKKLIPSMTPQELRFLYAKVLQWDVDGSGAISLDELKYALQVGR
jgi:Ca2+-binding EF-hand superfamily protein